MLKAIYIYIDILHNNALLSVRLSVLVLIYGRYLFHLITLINDNPAYLVKYHIMLPIQLLPMKNNLNLPVLYNIKVLFSVYFIFFYMYNCDLKP